LDLNYDPTQKDPNGRVLRAVASYADFKLAPQQAGLDARHLRHHLHPTKRKYSEAGVHGTSAATPTAHQYVSQGTKSSTSKRRKHALNFLKGVPSAKK